MEEEAHSFTRTCDGARFREREEALRGEAFHPSRSEVDREFHVPLASDETKKSPGDAVRKESMPK